MAAGADAIIVGALSSLTYYLLQSCFKIEENYPFSTSVQNHAEQTLNAFNLGVIDSLLVWPALFLSVLPEQLMWDIPFGSIPFFDSIIQMNSQVIPVIVLLINWLFHAAFESSKLHGTPGKVLFGLKLRPSNSARASFFQASQRHFAKIFSGLLLPELLRLLPALFKNGFSGMWKQCAKQVRRPLHDTASGAVVMPTARKKKVVSILACALVAFAIVAAIKPLPWAAFAMKNYDLATTIDPNFEEAY